MAETNSGTIKTQDRSVGDLIPFARNSRTHSEGQLAQIAASIREFGWTNPLLIDEDGRKFNGPAISEKLAA